MKGGPMNGERHRPWLKKLCCEGRLRQGVIVLVAIGLAACGGAEPDTYGESPQVQEADSTDSATRQSAAISARCSIGGLSQHPWYPSYWSAKVRASGLAGWRRADATLSVDSRRVGRKSMSLRNGSGEVSFSFYVNKTGQYHQLSANVLVGSRRLRCTGFVIRH